MDLRLAEREYICSDYTISDIVCYPWIARHERHQINLDDFPSVKRWFDTMSGRPAVRDAYDRAEKMNVGAPVTDASKSILFGQTAETVRGAVSEKRG